MLNDVFWFVLLITYKKGCGDRCYQHLKIQKLKKRSTFLATHKSVAQQHIQHFCSRQCSRQKNDVLRINPLTGKGFMCFVARVARFLKNIYITFLF